MSDLAPRYGDLSRGLYGSAWTLVQFIILPIILILISSALLESGGTGSMIGLDQAILGLRIVFIIFGSFLSVIGFFREFYPAGSLSRLMFGQVRAVVVIGLGYMLFIGSGMHDAIKQAGPDIDLVSLFYLFAVLVGLGMLYIVGEWVDTRWIWRKAKAEIDGVSFRPGKEHPPEDPKAHRVWHDFRFHYGRLTKGILMARSALLRYVIMPVALIIVLKAVISALGSTITDNLSGMLGTTMTFLFFIGIPIAVLSFFKGFYPKGSVSRMTFSIVIIALLDLWIWFATLQGRFQADLGMVQMDLNYQPYVLLLIFGVSLWAIYYVVELVSYRKDWISQDFEPVDESKAAERQLREKALKKARKNKERTG
jgi:hypothetical protein